MADAPTAVLRLRLGNSFTNAVESPISTGGSVPCLLKSDISGWRELKKAARKESRHTQKFITSHTGLP